MQFLNLHQIELDCYHKDKFLCAALDYSKLTNKQISKSKVEHCNKRQMPRTFKWVSRDENLSDQITIR